MNIQKPQKILFEINNIENLQNIEKEIKNEYQVINLISLIGVKIKT